MHLRFAFVLIVGLLLTTSVDARKKKDEGTNKDDVSPSTAEPSTADTQPTTQSEVSSTVVPQSSEATSATGNTEPTTQDVSATSAASGESTAAFTGTTVAPEGSTAAFNGTTAAPTTTGGTTGTPASTTPAPLPNVTVSVLQFAEPSCDSSVCTYIFNAPGNDQAFLATESAVIADDRSQYNDLQSAANSKDADIKKANDDAQQKIAELQALLDSIQTNLASIQSSIQVIKSNQLDAESTLQFVEKFITTINSAPDNCLYQSCLKPTTPAPPTTTPTPSPTTPPSPCLNFTCPDDQTGLQYCSLDSSNKPYCTNCLSNFDGYGHCDTVTCNSGGSGFVLSSDNNGTLYSTGYNINAPGNSSIPANANCRWLLNGTGGVYTTTSAFNLSCLASGNVAMTVSSSDGFSQTLASSTTMRALNSALKKITNPIFTLTSTAQDSSYCSIPLTWAPSTSEKKKQNGFFSWLIGY